MSTTGEVDLSTAPPDWDQGAIIVATDGEKVGSSVDSTRKDAIDVKKLEEILKVFQSQLDLQQRQLDLLRDLTENEIAPTANPTDKCNEDQKSILWMNERRPSGDVLKQISESFIKLCQSARVLWFFPTEYSVACDSAGTKGITGSPNLDKESALLAQRLLQKWLQSLGSESDISFQWKARLGIQRWYFCHTDGSISRAQVFIRMSN